MPLSSRLFGRPASATAPTPRPAEPTTSSHAAMDDLQESIALIEKREAHIQRLIDNEVVAARAHHAAGRKADALLAVKRKRLHDKERESLAAQKLNLITTEQQLSQMRFSSVIIDTQKKAAEALEREVKKVQGPEGAEAVAD